MTTGNDRVTERTLVAAMTEDVGAAPDAALAAVLEQTRQIRPLPRVIALVVEPPMVTPGRVVVGVRRSRLLLIAAALLLVVSLAASGVAGAWLTRLLTPAPPPDALEQLLTTGELRVALEPSTPADAAVGRFEEDVARAVAARLGLEPSIMPIPASDLAATSELWDVALPRTADWNLDRDVLVVSEPYYLWPREVLVSAASGATSLIDVQGQPVCAVAGDAGQAWLMGGFGAPSAAPASGPPIPSSLVVRDSDEECLASLEEGIVMAAVTGSMSPADIAANPEVRSISTVPPEPRAIAIRRGPSDPAELAAAIDRAIDDLRRNGTLAELSEAHFGADLSEAP